jgi:hypothetical protein
MNRNVPLLFMIALGAAACNKSTSTPAVLADSFFSAYAFVDANGNKQIDSADTPLKDAIFIVQLKSGAEFGGLTDKAGNAFVTIPAAVQYPVTLLMRPPKDSALKLIGPSSIVLQNTTNEKNNFLFTSK